MKRSKFSEAQIAFVLKQAEDGTPVGEVCRKAGISEATYYNWHKKYGGLIPSEMKRLRQLEEENAKFKRMNQHWFMNLDDAVRKCEAWRRDYNEVRPHSVIGNKPPISLLSASVAHGPP